MSREQLPTSDPRELDRGTVNVFDREPAPGNGAQRVGCALAREEGGHMQETWVLFSGYQPPRRVGNTRTGMWVVSAAPVQCSPELKAHDDYNLPTREQFLAALKKDRGEEPCTILLVDVRVGAFPPG